MAKKKATAAEQRHMGRVAALGCLLCDILDQPQEGPTKIHHIREGQGASQRASNWLVTPLCHECHQGDNGMHGTQALLRIAKVTELDLLAMTIERLSQ